MSLSVHDFAAFHAAVHGRPAFGWQQRLLEQIVAARAWPKVLDLPTGAGKTTCIDIALFALALDAQVSPERWCPRRIAMVVDRRIVVDQVAERGRKLLRALLAPGAKPVVGEVARRLRSLSSDGEEPLGVFTLRGGMPKDDGWARAPDQPLIIASTVDQLGSRLLIQGYGVSRGMKPVHAGLLGNDTLVLLDEVHLSQPFAETLDALDRLRRRFAQSLSTRFQHAFLSATPGESEATRFRLDEAETAPDAPLGPRLHASKRVRLLDAPDRPGLERACAIEACTMIARHDVVAVIVNRVASAAAVALQVRQLAGAEVDVVVLTGRMRPLDRDDVLRTLRPRVMTGRERVAGQRKLVVVGTQCLEAGADFDFDALVTEAAAFDALRQRFGRVDRLGIYGKSEGVIVRDKGAKDDPVYGDALPRTFAWLKERLDKKTRQIDFGILALPAPDENVRGELLAPKAHAPVLLPAYLDLWMQTSTSPPLVPDVSLWLHGPTSGPADVQVVWRADLTEHDLAAGPDAPASGDPVAIVATVRPSSIEAITLPFLAARRWLCVESVGDIADVEGAAVPADGEPSAGRRALRWNGDESEVITASQLRPGDTIVVPASRGGIRDGCFDGDSAATVTDLAERAALLGRGQPVLRLHPAILKQLDLALPLDDPAAARAELATVAAETERTSWRRSWCAALAVGKGLLTVEGAPPWSMLQGARIHPGELRSLLQPDEVLEDGIELTTDEDDSFHAGRAVSLAVHSADVERLARDFATAAGLPGDLVDDLALAGWLHDVGKADRRFQLLLRGGSEIDLLRDETPWAKSSMPPGARALHRLAETRSGYPKGGRHEVQSAAMLEAHVGAKAHEPDLVLYLVSSHHGHCRPFAPVVFDDKPVEVQLAGHRSARFGVADLGPVSSDHRLHRLDAPLPDRFWNLVEKYGWQELCWLEALLRLADHRASELEQRGGAR
ncbi:MAG TPA: type I-U CRISPR-associated helicase/endonuclease Cas3 [Polyangia bacterium]